MDKWLNDIHDRLKDYEQEPPRDLWSSLHARLQQEGLQGKTHRKPSAWTVWPRRIAVAACIAVAALVGYRHMTGPGQTASHRLAEAEESAGTQARTPHLPDALPREHATQAMPIALATQEQAGMAEAPAVPAGASSAPAITTLAADGGTAMASGEGTAVASGEGSTPLQAGSTQPEGTTQQRLLATTATRPRHDSSTRLAGHHTTRTQPLYTSNSQARLAVAAYAMGMGGNNSLARGMGGSPLTALGPDAAAWNDSPQLALAVFNQGKAIERKVHHRLPVRVGVSLSYDLNSHLALGSGLTYTHLRSDLREGTETNYQRSVQSLHYVGLPVNVRYTFLRHKGLSLYAQAGVLAEVRVGGKLATRYTLDGHTGHEETSHISSHPLQMSAGAAVGAQYNLTSALALYAEPGIGHYFKDNSSVPTIYEDKPTNFTLNVGVRLCLGR